MSSDPRHPAVDAPPSDGSGEPPRGARREPGAMPSGTASARIARVA